MAYQFVYVYEAYHDKSDNERELIGVFKDIKNAETAVKGKGWSWYAPDGTICNKLCILVDGKYFPLISTDVVSFVDDDNVEMLNLVNSLNQEQKDTLRKLIGYPL